MATVGTTITIYVHARRFYCFLWIVEALVMCGALPPSAALRIVERWSVPILAPYTKKPHGRFRLWT